MIIFNVVTSLPCSNLIFNSLTVSVRKFVRKYPGVLLLSLLIFFHNLTNTKFKHAHTCLRPPILGLPPLIYPPSKKNTRKFLLYYLFIPFCITPKKIFQKSLHILKDGTSGVQVGDIEQVTI